MSDWPPVWVLFATHKRTVACLRTIESLRQYLKYPNLHFHICDDGSGETDDGTNRWHVGVLSDAFAQWHPDVTWHELKTPPGQFNTGGNINQGIKIAQSNGCQIHMLDFDDWALFRELDLRPMVDVLDTCPTVGFIRLSYLTPGISGVCVRYDAKRIHQPHMWLRIIREWSLKNPWAVDRYLVSTQPYVAHTRFFEAYGWHPENVNPGLAETGLGAQYLHSAHGEAGPQILYNLGVCITHAPWRHLVERSNDYAKL